VALIGAPLVDAPAVSCGAAYVFERYSRTPVVRLGGEDPAAFGEFGESVALCGQTALVGKSGDDHSGEYTGAACLYRNDGKGHWNRVARLVAADAAAGEQFGISVALAEGIALVGSRGKDCSGSVYVFEEASPGSWQQVAKLTSHDQSSEDHFGWPIAVSGELVVVGAHLDTVERHYPVGAAYVFQRDAMARWKQIAKLAPPEGNNHQRFGRAIALCGRTVAVGSPGLYSNCGIVYLFHQDSSGDWQPIAQLKPRDTASSSCFGQAVAMRGGTIAVGAPLQKQAAGAVYLFQSGGDGGWQQIAKITVPGRPTDRWFGASLALSDNALLVGAYRGPGNTPKSGAAYLFRLGNRGQVDSQSTGYARNL
jgi:hypothetical protein